MVPLICVRGVIIHISRATRRNVIIVRDSEATQNFNLKLRKKHMATVEIKFQNRRGSWKWSVRPSGGVHSWSKGYVLRLRSVPHYSLWWPPPLSWTRADPLKSSMLIRQEIFLIVARNRKALDFVARLRLWNFSMYYLWHLSSAKLSGAKARAELHMREVCQLNMIASKTAG